jgi:hypothetical protein
MDGPRFDRLAKTLSTSGTRRALLRLLAAVPIAGGLLTVLHQEAVQAGKGKHGKHGKGRNGGHGGKGAHGHKGNNDNDGQGGKGGTGSNPCRGKADETCCGDGSSPTWCQGGKCVAIGPDATATLAECQGRCACTPGFSGSVCTGTEPTPALTICGTELACPSCADACPAPCGQKNGLAPGGTQPAGPSFYCAQVGWGACEQSSPCPSGLWCLDDGDCYKVCLGDEG